jgi:hypothetical protein
MAIERGCHGVSVRDVSDGAAYEVSLTTLLATGVYFEFVPYGKQVRLALTEWRMKVPETAAQISLFPATVPA